MHIRLCVDPKESRAFHGTLLGAVGSQASEVTAMDAAPVPPPPIPPPPPPPPPPPTPATSLGRLDSAVRRQRLRNLNWERIPKERVEGCKNVWSFSLAADDDFPIDLHSLDELFGQKEARKTERGDSFRRSLRRCRSPQEACADKVSILDSKRSMNVGIFLRQFKTAAKEIVEDVRQGAGERHGAEKLAELCKLLPDTEEEARLKRFNGERSTLGEPDLFMLFLVEVPNVRLRLDAMILQQEFDPAVNSLCVAARCLGEAARELLSCHRLHSILRLVLKAGNYMNAGGYAGNAAGFRIASLLKLADTKANKPGMNLLHFVAMEAVKKDEDLLTFPSQLSHVSSASRLSEESVLEDLCRLQNRVAALRVSAQAEAEIEQQTRTFLEIAEVRLKEAQDEVDCLRKTSEALVEFFCEDENSFKLEEACSIFHCFCHRFQKAVRENTERERQEQRRAERERESMEKRRSLALCGGLDLGREPDDLERTLERSLSHTWSRRSLRRHSQHSLSTEYKNSDSNSTSPLLSEGQDLQQVLSSEGYSRISALSRHALTTDSVNNNTNNQNRTKADTPTGACVMRTDSAPVLHRDTAVCNSLDRPDNTAAAKSKLNPTGASTDNAFIAVQHQDTDTTNASLFTGQSTEKVLETVEKVERQEVFQKVSERLADITADCILEDVEKQDSTDAAEANSQHLLCKITTVLEDSTSTTGPVVEVWPGSCPAEVVLKVVLAQEPEPASPERERTFPRVGETVECHTLVKGLRSYEVLSPPAGSRQAPSHCSKWRKELQAEEREGAESSQAKEDMRTGKTSVRGSIKRGMMPRSSLSNSTGVPKVRAKAESSLPEASSTPRASRLTPPQTSSMRLSPITRPTSIQSELKRSSSTRDKLSAQSDTAVKQNRRPAEKSGHDKEKALSNRETFVRGSPLRVTKRFASTLEPQSPNQTRTVHSPTAATNAKTIRTAVINAAKAKTAKNTETTSAKATPGTRITAPKIPRPAAAQPMWR